MLSEPFDITVGAGVVLGAIRLPSGTGPWPAVLVACDLPGSRDEHDAVVDDLAAQLAGAGMATAVRFAARTGDAAAVDDAASVIDDASAAFRWLRGRDDIDPLRVGVLGRGLGAVVACGLAGRTDEITRVCLVSPATAEDALGRLAKRDDSEPLFAADTRTEAYRASLAALTPVADLIRHRRRTLILQPAADRVIPAACAVAYLTALEVAGHDVEQTLVARADHALTEPDLRTLSLARIGRFFSVMATADEKVA